MTGKSVPARTAGEDRAKAKAEEERLQRAAEEDLKTMQANGNVAAEPEKEDPVKSKPKNPKKAPKPRAAKPSKIRGVDWDAAQKKAKADAKEDLVVFAFRLTPAERDAIHKAAGPAKASRFVRTLAVAAARKDQAQVREILKAVGAAE